MSWFHFVIDPFGLSEESREEILQFIAGQRISVSFVRLQDCKAETFDVTISMNCLFRHISPSLYKTDPEIQRLLDTGHPIFSDQNHIVEFVEHVHQTMKNLLYITKVGGVVFTYPCVLSWQLFDLIEKNQDIRILDWAPEVTYTNNANSTPPSFANSPISLHFEPNPAYHSFQFTAPELLDTSKGVKLSDAQFFLDETSPDLVEYFAGFGILVGLYSLSYACSVEKLRHVHYQIDSSLFDEYLQFPTRTMRAVSKIKDKERIQKQRFLHSVKYGFRVGRSYRAFGEILSDLDVKWSREAYSGDRISPERF